MNGNLKLDPAAQAYVSAVAAKDLPALVGSFTSDAIITDVNRRIIGRSAIEEWARNEVIGGSLEVLELTAYVGGQDLLVRFTPAGSSSGFRAHYRFDIQNGKISGANLQYA